MKSVWKWIWRDFNVVSLPQIDIKQLLWIWLFWLCCGNSIIRVNIFLKDLYHDCHLISFDSKLWSFKKHITLSIIENSFEHEGRSDVNIESLYSTGFPTQCSSTYFFTKPTIHKNVRSRACKIWCIASLYLFLLTCFFEFYTWKGYNFKSIVAPLFCFLINGIVFVSF